MMTVFDMTCTNFMCSIYLPHLNTTEEEPKSEVSSDTFLGCLLVVEDG